MNQSKKWKELGAGERTQLITAVVLVGAAIVLGFLSFLWLQMIPGSVLAQSGVYLSGALAIFGISAYFKSEMTEFQSEVKKELGRLSEGDRRNNQEPS